MRLGLFCVSACRPLRLWSGEKTPRVVLMIVLVIRNEAEASQMFAWASRFAEGSHLGLEVIVAMDGKEAGTLSKEEPKEAWLLRMRDSLPNWASLSWCRSKERTALLLDYLQKNQVELLVVGKHDSKNRTDSDILLAQSLFESASCPVLVIRVGEGMPDSRDILVPCSGGRHSRRALGLAYSFAPKAVTALFITTNSDEVSHLMGDSYLQKAIEKADVPKDEVRQK